MSSLTWVGMGILYLWNKYLCTCQGDTDSEKDLQEETRRRNCTHGFQNPSESPTAKLSSRNPHCNHFTTTLVPRKLGLRRSSGCFKLSCLWKCHPPIRSHMKWAIFLPQSLLFSQGQEHPWGSAGHVFHIISLWVLRNIFLQPGQGIPPGRTASGLVHKVQSAPLKYKASKQPPTQNCGSWVQISDGCQNSKQSLMAFTVQKQACLIIIFSTFLRLVIMYFWFTVLMPGNSVTFILPCRITWEYSLERISHWAKVKKQSRHVASSKVPSHISEI